MSNKTTLIGVAVAAVAVGIAAVLSSTTCQVKFKVEKPTMKKDKMYKIETAIDTVATLELLYKLSAFIRAKATDPKQLKMETSISGEIELRMGNRTLVKAERDFFNEQSWSIEVVEELREIVHPDKKMF